MDADDRLDAQCDAAATAGRAGQRRPLERLLHHLQGSFDGLPQDAGLARLHPQRLREIEAAARACAGHSLERLGTIARLLAASAAESGGVGTSPVHREALAHLGALTLELECWVRLGDSAREYLDAPMAARVIANRMGASAQMAGEWPEPLV
ncbi:hypothetical protein [Coralloluteibacterium thermophilus]|uniref:Hpt domain-containing protein n=1 Tax=Coralloluteibacterium thermophilum TaxID=2707049 RepID=A0ABV9NR50_9GAMM